MKKLFALILLLCVYSSLYAQKLSVGLRGGINYCTAPLGLSKLQPDGNPLLVKDVSGKMAGIAALRFMMDTKKFQLGLSYEHAQLSYTWGQKYIGYDYPNLNYYAKTGVRQLLVIASIKKNMHRSYLYFGIDIGVASIKVKNTKFDITVTPQTSSGYYPPLQPGTFNPGPDSLGIQNGEPDHSNIDYPGIYTFTSGMRPVFGAQAGYSYNLTKHFSVSGELAARYVSGDIASYIYTALGWLPIRLITKKGLIYFPATIGINYSF